MSHYLYLGHMYMLSLKTFEQLIRLTERPFYIILFIQDFILSKSFVIDNWGLEPTDFPFYPEDVFRE